MKKIGLDLHGVISDMTEFFGYINAVLIGYGDVEIHILTGSTIKKAELELKEIGWHRGIHYTHLFSIPDFHTQIGTEIVGVHPIIGNNEFSKENWDKTKADYCLKNNIDLMIDDTIDYGEYFKTPFARLWTKDR